MDDIVRVEIEKLSSLERNLSEFVEAKYTTKITSYRGKVIKQLKKIIKLLKEKENKSQEEIDYLSECEDKLGEELFSHKTQLNSRYSEEFIHGEAKVPDIITTFPKGVALQAQKVANAIDEIKSAKDTKAKTVAIANFAKQTGLFVATPAIFTGKFIIEHWYLLLLFLGWELGKKAGKSKENEQKEPEEVPEYVTEEVPENVPVTSKEPALVGEPEFVPNKVPGTANEGLHGTGIPNTSAINYQTDPRFSKPEVSSPEKPFSHEHVNGHLIKPEVQASDNIDIHLTEEDQFVVDELNSKFIDTLEYEYKNVVIGSRHPGVVVVHSAKEFVDYLHSIGVSINEEDAEFRYIKNISGVSNRIDIGVIWPEVDKECLYFENEQEFAKYLLSGEKQELSEYYERFIKNDGNMNLISQVGEILKKPEYGKFMNELGISGTEAAILFGLYELIQYGLAYPTGGLSLLAPG